MNFEKIIIDIEKGIYKPIYFLHGEEPFYIDQITNLLLNKVLDESEKDFNQTILYGGDTTIDEIINVSKRYPMMSPYQLVVVREAQHLTKTIDKLVEYIKSFVPTTILVINYKNKKLDKRKELGKLLNKEGYLFESIPIKDFKLPEWIVNYGKSKKIKIQPKAAILLAECIGSNMSGIVSAIEKLEVNLDKSKIVNVENVQNNIGFSKDFNLFELQNAIAEKNIFKSNLIINHFGNNKKNHPFILTISSLYIFFTKLMKFHFYSNNLTANELANKIGVHPYFLKQYKLAASNYSKNKLARIFSYLRDYDLKSKGVDNTSTSDDELLKELIFKILH